MEFLHSMVDGSTEPSLRGPDQLCRPWLGSMLDGRDILEVRRMANRTALRGMPDLRHDLRPYRVQLGHTLRDIAMMRRVMEVSW